MSQLLLLWHSIWAVMGTPIATKGAKSEILTLFRLGRGCFLIIETAATMLNAYTSLLECRLHWFHSMCCIQRHICLNLATAQSLMPMHGPNQKAEANMQNLSVSNQMGMSEGFSTLSYGPSKLCFLPLCSTRWSHENKTKQKKIKQNKNKQTDRQTNKQTEQTGQ